jgi:hypothetical protein
MMLEMFITLISALTALVAVLVSPMVSFRIARNRARFEAIVMERVETPRGLRKIYSEFIAYPLICNAERGLGRLSHATATEKLGRAVQLETELSLLLDPKNESERVVLENITAARNRVFKDSDGVYQPQRWEEHYAAHAALLQVISAETKKIAKLE